MYFISKRTLVFLIVIFIILFIAGRSVFTIGKLGNKEINLKKEITKLDSSIKALKGKIDFVTSNKALLNSIYYKITPKEKQVHWQKNFRSRILKVSDYLYREKKLVKKSLTAGLKTK